MLRTKSNVETEYSELMCQKIVSEFLTSPPKVYVYRQAILFQLQHNSFPLDVQSQPDHFEFEGSRGSISTQIGNAVPPLMGRAIGKSISNIIDSC